MDFLTTSPEIREYSFVKELTSGTLSGSWKAVNNNNKNFYAIKSIDKSQFQTPEQNAKFLNDIYILKQVNNKYIASLIDLIDESNAYHIVYELPEGCCLREYLENNGPMTEKTIKDLISHLYYITYYTREQLGFKFCNINAENIFVDENGQLTKYVLSSENSIKELSNNPKIIPFLAPEYLSTQKFHPNSDSWCFGCIVYLCLSTRLPFLGPVPEATIKSVLSNHESVPDTASEDAKNFIERCLVKNPLMRLAIVDMFSVNFMEGVTMELPPNANERRFSGSYVEDKNKGGHLTAVTTNRRGSESFSNDNGSPGTFGKKQMVRVSYKSGFSQLKRQNSKNKTETHLG